MGSEVPGVERVICLTFTVAPAKAGAQPDSRPDARVGSTPAFAGVTEIFDGTGRA